MARYLDESEKALWQKVVETINPLEPKRRKAISDKGPSPSQTAPSANKVIISNRKSQDKGAISHSENRFDNDGVNNLMPTRDDLARALSKPISRTPAADNSSTPYKRPTQSQQQGNNGLDGRWDKRIGKGVIIPDISIDLHGAGLQSAYDRLDGALEQAKAQKLRVILLVTGRQRNYDRASGEGRGGIRAVISDWLSASRHSDNIASVRNAHPRHGGAGALYIILRRA